MTPQILITGATGFIGRRLTRDLVASGGRVRVLARSPGKAQDLFGDNVEICDGDLGDPSAAARACRGIDVIYHIGGIYRFGLRHRRELWRINVEGTENLLQSASAAGVGRMVHLSSAGLLKKVQSDDEAGPADENDFPAQAPACSSYKYSKWHAEQRVLEWAQRGFPAVIASTTCPIGAGDEIPTPTGQIIRDFLDRRFPFYCRAALNFIGVGDLSQGLQRVASHGQNGRRYLLSHQNLWLKEFLDLLAEETGLPAPRRCLPNGLIFLAGCGGEAFDFLNPRSTGARVCLETAFQARHVQFFSNARAREELGWQPVRSLPESIREAVAWFRETTEVELPAPAAAAVQSHVR